jgi:hypothetical protein
MKSITSEHHRKLVSAQAGLGRASALLRSAALAMRADPYEEVRPVVRQLLEASKETIRGIVEQTDIGSVRIEARRDP